MATVTLQADEELLKKANKALARTSLTLDQVFERALREVAEREEASRQFEEMAAEFRAKGYSFPILSREERNARR